MSFANSSLTLEDLQTRANFDRQEQIDNQIIVQAVNDALSIYERAERAAYPNRYSKTVQNQAITSSGIDLLVVIPDIGSDEEGFRVYRDEIKVQNLIPETERGSTNRGYFIEENTLFITPEFSGSQSFGIKYVKNTTRFELGIDLSITPVPIDRDAELAFTNYFLSRFYNRENQDGLKVDFEERFFDELTRLFRKPFRCFT